MRYQGTIIQWNDDRGFGFIAGNDGSNKLFIHISAFADRNNRPGLGKIVLYEVGKDNNGRERAINAAFPVMAHSAKNRSIRQNQNDNSVAASWLKLLLSVSVIIFCIFVIWQSSKKDQNDIQVNATINSDTQELNGSDTNSGDRFVCDGRIYCSDMSSYEEARFFIENCPGTQMDGDGDGNPCEKQFNQ